MCSIDTPLPLLCRYPLKAINVLKAHGKSAKESALLDGYALNMGRAAQGMVQAVKGARIACLDVNLQKTKMQFGVQARARWLLLCFHARPFLYASHSCVASTPCKAASRATSLHLLITAPPSYCSLRPSAQVLVTDPKELEKIRERESDITKGAQGCSAAATADVLP